MDKRRKNVINPYGTGSLVEEGAGAFAICREFKKGDQNGEMGMGEASIC